MPPTFRRMLAAALAGVGLAVLVGTAGSAIGETTPSCPTETTPTQTGTTPSTTPTQTTPTETTEGPPATTGTTAASGATRTGTETTPGDPCEEEDEEPAPVTTSTTPPKTAAPPPKTAPKPEPAPEHQPAPHHAPAPAKPAAPPAKAPLIETYSAIDLTPYLPPKPTEAVWPTPAGMRADHARAAYLIADAHWPGSPCKDGERVAMASQDEVVRRAGAAAPKDTSLLLVAYADSDGCRVWLNEEATWTPARLCMIAEHEFGHLAGRAHAADPDDVMAPIVRRAADCEPFFGRWEPAEGEVFVEAHDDGDEEAAPRKRKARKAARKRRAKKGRRQAARRRAAARNAAR